MFSLSHLDKDTPSPVEHSLYKADTKVWHDMGRHDLGISRKTGRNTPVSKAAAGARGVGFMEYLKENKGEF